MDTNKFFTENKAVINGETVQICCSRSQPRFRISKIHPLSDATFNPDCLTPLTFLKIVTDRYKKWILVMLSRIVTCRKNFQILIGSPLRMKSLHLLSKFHGYIFNGLGEKLNLKLPPEILCVDLKLPQEIRLPGTLFLLLLSTGLTMQTFHTITHKIC